jgi:basic membrane lipoprotein Med (substrate-binding protein (PBP1-ABC) superfamily)
MTEPNKDVSRRQFMKYAAAGVGAVALAGAAYYLGTQGQSAPVQTTITSAPTATATQVNKVHLILYGHTTGGAWDPQLYDTLVSSITKSNYDWKLTVSEGVTEESVSTTMEQAATNNDLVIASTIVYEGAVKSVAPRFPNVHFILENDPIAIDPTTLVSATDYPPNVILVGPGCMTNNYVIGAVAAKIVGPDAKLGFIQALDVPSGVHTGAMFRAGAQSVYPQMQVLRNINGDFVTPVKNRDAINFMASSGVKAVFVEQDDTSGILQSVEDKIYVVPSYKDQASLAPDSVLASSIWNWEPAWTDLMNAHASGTWDQYRASKYYWVMTLANNGLGLGTFGNMVTDDLKTFANGLVQDINSGAKSIPYLDTW